MVTAREPLGLFTASWQEYVKNRGVIPMSEYSVGTSDDPSDVWNWRGLDLRLVLERWAPAFPAERVHVLPLPGPSAPEREIWDRFARLVGADPDSVDLGRSFPNASMGVAEAETLRRINLHLADFNSAIDRGTYIRTFLADERLVPRGGERFWPSAERVEEIRGRGRAAIEHITTHGYDVVGDLSTLLVPDDLPDRRTPESVTDGEVSEVAVELVARMLGDVRELRHERRRLRGEIDALARARGEPGPAPGPGHEVPVDEPLHQDRVTDVRQVMAGVVIPASNVARAARPGVRRIHRPPDSDPKDAHAAPVRDRRPHRHPGRDHQDGAAVRRHQDPPGGHRARARRRVPDRDRRGPQGAGHLRADDPRGVRRPGGVPADLRPRRRGDRARLDERLGRHQHPLHRRLHAPAARHRGAEAEVPAEDGHRRGAWLLLDVRAGAGLRRGRDQDQGRQERGMAMPSPARRCG